MKVALSSIGKFHTFDLARELDAQGFLAGIYTGYPRFKLHHEGLSQSQIHTFPYLHTFYMGFPFWGFVGKQAKREWAYWDHVLLDRYVARHLVPCDVYSGLSGSSLKTGGVVKERGGCYVCDRGSSHIRMQERILREEYARWGLPCWSVDPRSIEREEAEYALADAIVVPSTFAKRSFIECGVSEKKIRLLPFGVNLERFHKVSDPAPRQFDVLFVGGVSLRKGIPDLLNAFAKVLHPRKKLILVGSFEKPFVRWLSRTNLLSDKVSFLGPVPQAQLKEIMSRSHVMVLPSVEEGLALVQAQALACGCPVIATTNTGASDLFEDGKEGFIVPIRNAEAITEKLQLLSDKPELRQAMSQAALARVSSIGGWRAYGERAIALFKELSR